MSKKGKLILKIIMWAFLLHIILITLTIFEVFIYSTFINSGHDSQFYEAHAQKSGPYVAIIIGFILTYVIALRLAKKNPAEKGLICIGIPVGYIALDIIILLLMSGTDLSGSAWIFGISYTTKLLAGYAALKTN